MTNRKVIVVLAGGVSRGGALGWRSSVFGEKADISIAGSYVRVAAAALLWRQDPSAVIVTSGGRGQADTVFPPGLSLSTIMKQELAELGVPASVILEESRSGNTYQQLLAIVELATQNHWLDISIVSSRFHLPRIQAMVECLSGLEVLRPITSYIPAEDVVLAAEPDKWREPINTAYGSDEFAEIISSEERGTAQVRSGEYKVS